MTPCLAARVFSSATTKTGPRFGQRSMRSLMSAEFTPVCLEHGGFSASRTRGPADSSLPTRVAFPPTPAETNDSTVEALTLGAMDVWCDAKEL